MNDTPTAHLDDGLLFDAHRPGADPALLERVDRHRSLCAACAQEAESVRLALSTARADAPPPLSPNLVDRLVGATLDGSVAARMAAEPGRRRWAVGAVAAAVVAVALFLSLAALRISTRTGVPDPATPALATIVFEPDSERELFRFGDGREIASPSDRRVGVRLGRSTTALLDPAARIRVVHDFEALKELRVETGRVRVEVHGRAATEQVRVTIPDGTIEVTGTVFYVDVGSARREIGVEEGRIRFVDLAGKELFVSAGGHLVVDAGGPVLRVSATGKPSARPPAAEPSVPSTDALYARAEEALRSGEPARAAEALEQLIRIHPASGAAEIAWFELARLREQRLGDPGGAAAAYRRYLALGEHAPLHEEARRALCRIEPRTAERCDGRP